MKRFVRHILFSSALVLAGSNGSAQELNFEGMLAGWMTGSQSQNFNAQTGLRYIPGLSGEYKINEKYTLDAELSGYVSGTATFWSDDSISLDERLKPYRMWARFSGDQFEIRAGLQKINFGSATILRPLMWFDQIDPRDPLQLTDGVYGLLGRYYFLNNANIWVWALYGNKNVKGWESVASDKNKVEYGSRVQYPVSDRGELALTYHHRNADYSSDQLADTRTGKYAVNENRIGLDGKFDLGVGLWFEGTLAHQNLETNNIQQALNLGLDYTFRLGNGLNLMSELVIFDVSDKAFTSGQGVSFTAVSLNYPLNIFINLNAIIFYDLSNNDIYNFANFSLQFDKWSFYVMGFWNPDRFNIYQNLEGTNLFAGKGMQLMFVYNH